MNVQLISISKGFGIFENKSGEDIITGVARVSSGRSLDDLFTDGPKLLGYLIKNKHWSPFEMCSMCVKIETSRAIAQQILRHRSFSFQEFSQRYAAALETEPVEMRYQAEKNRQSSTIEVDDIFLNDKVQDHITASMELYDELLGHGVAKETARFILPLTTKTTMYMMGTIRSWIHYLEIRDHDHVQKEHREIAIEIKKIFVENFPIISEALEW